MNTKADFTLKVVKHLLENKFSVLLHNKDQINGYGGWLETEEDNKELCVAMAHHMGFEILLHEYCHFLQYKTDRKFWDDSALYYDVLFDWAEDPNFVADDEILNKSLNTILRIEHDCEKRALKLIYLNPIEDFDVVKYRKAANAYLWSYHIMRKLRKRPKKPIYTEQVLSTAPDYFENSLDFYMNLKNLSKDFEESLLKEF
jgi:hypothetical protein